MAEYCKNCSDKLGLEFNELSEDEICEGCKSKGYKLTIYEKVILAIAAILLILSFGF